MVVVHGDQDLLGEETGSEKVFIAKPPTSLARRHLSQDDEPLIRQIILPPGVSDTFTSGELWLMPVCALETVVKQPAAVVLLHAHANLPHVPTSYTPFPP